MKSKKFPCIKRSDEIDYGPIGRFYGYGPKEPIDSVSIVSPFWKEKYEKEANKFWNKFYKNNQANFFKDRHWITKDFPEILKEKIEGESPKLLEVGCGAGNTIFPLLEENPHLFIYAFDFASTAVSLVQQHPAYTPERVKAFVFDPVLDPLPEFLQQKVHFVTLIYVLSAVSPQQMDTFIQKIYQALKPGGIVFFRDYAVNDLAQERFQKGQTILHSKKLDENFYVRGDGTRAYYFSEEFLKQLFIQHGFVVDECRLIERLVINMKENKNMDRIFLHAKLRKQSSF